MVLNEMVLVNNNAALPPELRLKLDKMRVDTRVNNNMRVHRKTIFHIYSSFSSLRGSKFNYVVASYVSIIRLENERKLSNIFLVEEGIRCI